MVNARLEGTDEKVGVETVIDAVPQGEPLLTVLGVRVCRRDDPVVVLGEAASEVNPASGMLEGFFGVCLATLLATFGEPIVIDKAAG